MSNKYYYDELARMSLIMSNAVSNGNSGVDNNQETKDMSYINTAMASIGMNCNYENVIKDSFKVGLAIGHKEIEYADIKKNVVLIAVSNARDLEEYNSFADVGETGWTNSLNSNHHKPYEILANEVYNKVKSYLQTNNVTENVVYWITGYGTGGGIANILSAKMIDKPLVSTDIKVPTILWFSKDVNTGMTNIYTYTFGAPNVAYTLDEDIGINNNKYKSIFNVVDTNDVTAHMLSMNTGWHKYGWNMSIDKNYEKCQDVVNAYSNLMKEKTRDDVYVKQKNKNGTEDEMTIKEILEYIQVAKAYNDLNGETFYFDGLSAVKSGTYKTFVNKYFANYKALEPSHSIKNYFALCKQLLPEHMHLGDKWEVKKIETKTDVSYQDLICEAIEVMGQQYVKNVSTYQEKKYKLEDIAKDIDKAYKENRNAYNTLNDVGIGEQREEIKRKFNNLIENNTWFRCGDDCVRFMFSVIYYALNGDLGDELSNENSNNHYTLIDTGDIMKDEYDSIFTNLGFEIHYIGEKDNAGHQFCYDDLEDGDILISYRDNNVNKGHIEFYIGDKYGENPSWKYGWSFGWGSAKSKYPSNSHFAKTISVDTTKKENKQNYLKDLVVNKDKYVDKVNGIKYDYELRYYKVLRMVK